MAAFTHTTPHGVNELGLPAITPNLGLEAEILMLLALRARTSNRLNELTEQVRTLYVLPPSPLQRMRAEDAATATAVTLPRSGLSQSRPGILLFKGGRDA